MESTTRWGKATGATLGAGALLFTFACGGTRDASTVAAPQLTTNQAGAPVLVSCEPHQRTLVRQTVVNGQAVSQVECVAAAQTAAYTTEQGAMATPVAYAPNGVYAPAASRPVYSEIGDAQVVPVASYPTVRRAPAPVRTRQVIYDERPVRQTRSKTKSAIIIGSSAGVGAGVGAAVGGKKGALIGAAIGGGGAAIWDQVTRRR